MNTTTCGELSCDECNARTAALTVERDQLRAEVERLKTDGAASAFVNMSCRASRAEDEVKRLKRDYDYDHKCLHEVRERCESWKQRAERAEADAAAYLKRAESFSKLADEAEADLAAERAKVQMLREDLAFYDAS